MPQTEGVYRLYDNVRELAHARSPGVGPAMVNPRPVGEDTREARRVAFMMAAIAAFRRDKARAAAAASAASGGAGGDPWKAFSRRSQMRGGLR